VKHLRAPLRRGFSFYACRLILSDESPARTVDAGEGRFIDLDAEDNVLALEVLGAGHGFRLTDLVEQFNLEPLLDGLRRERMVAQSLAADERLDEVLSTSSAVRAR
jgi:hypothetical protein